MLLPPLNLLGGGGGGLPPGPPVPTPKTHDCPFPSHRSYEERNCFHGKWVEKKVNLFSAFVLNAKHITTQY